MLIQKGRQQYILYNFRSEILPVFFGRRHTVPDRPSTETWFTIDPPLTIKGQTQLNNTLGRFQKIRTIHRRLTKSHKMIKSYNYKYISSKKYIIINFLI